MALSVDLQYAGLKLSKCYVRIENVSGGKRDGWRGLVKVYISEEIAKNPSSNISAVKEFTATAPYNKAQMNPFVVLYETISEMPEFKHATNV
jgi:hypothetical protein